MNQRTAFLRCILEHPGDDPPRLIFADWLEENGEAERAEFVRCQIRLAREYWDEHTGKASDHLLMSAGGTYCKLRERERELWETSNGNGGWLIADPVRGLPSYIDQNAAAKSTSIAMLLWRRGFVCMARLSWADWLAHHERLVWSPGQRVGCRETCPQCRGSGREAFITYNPPNFRAMNPTDPIQPPPPIQHRTCQLCHGVANRMELVPRPFTDDLAETVQPLERVELTEVPDVIENYRFARPNSIDQFEVNGYRFNRVKCPTCAGKIFSERMKCHCGNMLLNEWQCDQWPQIVLSMPPVPDTIRWRNYTMQYTDITLEELVERTAHAFYQTQFQPPLAR